MPVKKNREHEYRITTYTEDGQLAGAMRIQTFGNAGHALSSAIRQYDIPRKNTFVVEYMGPPGTIMSIKESIKAIRKHFVQVFKKEGLDVMMEGP